MLTRIVLIVAVLAGAGVISVTQFQVRPRLQGMIDQRDQARGERELEKGGRLKAQRELKETAITLAAVSKSLAEAQAEQAATQARLDREQGITATLRTDLAKTQAGKLAAEQEAARLAGAQNQAAQLQARNTELVAKNDRLGKRVGELEMIVGPFPPPPSDLRAKVIGVDPKWDFVVLDIGQEHNVKPTWSLIVSRNGTLVGKVQITSVLKDRCIANVLPGWKLDELLEGDQVMPEIRLSRSVGNPCF